MVELYKEFLKQRRQKILMTESYELEIVEPNTKIKNNELEQRYNSSGIDIIINSKGQSASKSIRKFIMSGMHILLCPTL